MASSAVRSAHVGQLFFADCVYVKVVVFGVLADDHAFVNFDAGADEQLAALLQVPEGIGGGGAGAVGDQRAGQAVGNFALPLGVAVEERVHHDGAARVGEQLAAQADEAAAGDAELHAHAAVAVVVHVRHLGLAHAELFHHHADEFFGNVDGEVFDRLHELAVESRLVTISGLPTMSS